MADESDNELTSLTWLHTVNIMPNVSVTPPSTTEFTQNQRPQINKTSTSSSSIIISTVNSTGGGNNNNNNVAAADVNCSTAAPQVANNVHKKKLLVHQKTNAHKLAEFHNRMLLEVDYKNDENAKPPYSYAALICLSMKDTKKKMTLSQIYKWIRENFAYYRKANRSWQNSIRHNLSLNKCFIKVARTKQEPGKGGFWTLDPQYQKEPSDENIVESANNTLATLVTHTQGQQQAFAGSPRKLSKPGGEGQTLDNTSSINNKRKRDRLGNNSTKICLKFVNESASSSSKSLAPPATKRPMTLRSPLMPTSAECCTTSMGTDNVVNLTYSLPNNNNNNGDEHVTKLLPLSLATLTPLPRTDAAPAITSALKAMKRDYDLMQHQQQGHLPPLPPLRQMAPIQNPHQDQHSNWQHTTVDLSSAATIPLAEYMALMGSCSQTPPNLASAAEDGLSPNTLNHAMEEDLFHNEDTITPTLDLPLYSTPSRPQQQQQQAGNASASSNVYPGTLEEWVKQPGSLTLSSDTLIASLTGAGSAEVSSSPSTPTSLFHENALPSFQQTHATTSGYELNSTLSMWDENRSLPALENTLNLDNLADLDGLSN